nr:site-specific integrase [Candidatus Reidiella endopervernicosa]
MDKGYIYFHHKKHPADLGEVELTAFLTHLAVEKNVTPSTQNQALSALLFFINRCLELSWRGWMMWFGRRSLPVCRRFFPKSRYCRYLVQCQAPMR